jgi:hypothetical protein
LRLFLILYKMVNGIPQTARAGNLRVSSRRGMNKVPASKSATAPLTMLMMIKRAVPSTENTENKVLTMNTISNILAGLENIRSYQPMHHTKAIMLDDR